MAERGGFEPSNCVLLCLGVCRSVMLETLEFQRLTLQSVEIVGVAETLFSDSFGAKMVHAKRPEEHPRVFLRM